MPQSVTPEVAAAFISNNPVPRGELPALIQTIHDKRTGLSRELGSGRTRVEGLGSCSGRSRSPPILKRFASESAERIAGNEMTLDVERVLDCGMNGQEPLC